MRSHRDLSDQVRIGRTLDWESQTVSLPDVAANHASASVCSYADNTKPGEV